MRTDLLVIYNLLRFLIHLASIGLWWCTRSSVPLALSITDLPAGRLKAYISSFRILVVKKSQKLKFRLNKYVVFKCVQNLYLLSKINTSCVSFKVYTLRERFKLMYEFPRGSSWNKVHGSFHILVSISRFMIILMRRCGW